MLLAVTTLTWLEVLDDGVKIGLGALIAGLFAWLVARHNSKGLIQKLQFERRSTILSQVAQTYELVFQAWLKYSNLLSAVAKMSQNPPQDNLDSTFHRIFVTNKTTEAVNLQEQVMLRMQESFSAQSQLLLLGEQQCVEKAEAFSVAVIEANVSFKFDGQSVDLTHFGHNTKVVRDAREAFYQEMQKAFGKT